jgi:hypothetical protein
LNLRFPFGKTSLAVRRTRPGYATSPKALRVVVYRGLSFKIQILFLSFLVVLTAFHLLEMRSRSVVQEFYKPKYKKALE